MVEPPFQADQHGPAVPDRSLDTLHYLAPLPGAIFAKEEADRDPTLDQRLRFRNDRPAHQQPKRIIDAVRDRVLQFAFVAECAEAALEQAREHAWCQEMVGVDQKAHGVDHRVQAAKAVEVALLKRLELASGARQT